MAASSSVPCPAVARYPLSFGGVQWAPLLLGLRSPWGLPQVPSTALPRWVRGVLCGAPSRITHLGMCLCTSELTHHEFLLCTGCSCVSLAHAHVLFVFPCWLHGVPLTRWPWAQLLPAGVTLPFPALAACPSPTPRPPGWQQLGPDMSPLPLGASRHSAQCLAQCSVPTLTSPTKEQTLGFGVGSENGPYKTTHSARCPHSDMCSLTSIDYTWGA